LFAFPPLRCLKVTTSPTDILVIEDLNEKGFKMAKKSQGLLKHQMEAVLKKLAQFHAASAVDIENNGAALDEKYSRGIYNVDMKEIFEQNFEAFFGFVLSDCLSTWPDLDAVILDKLVSSAVECSP
jgi:Ecdysteroid kinase-like family